MAPAALDITGGGGSYRTVDGEGTLVEAGGGTGTLTLYLARYRARAVLQSVSYRRLNTLAFGGLGGPGTLPDRLSRSWALVSWCTSRGVWGRYSGWRCPAEGLAPHALAMGGAVRQEVRFCAAPDATRIAYAIHGSGPPLVRTATWLTHLEFDWESPVWRHWLDGLAERHMVLRYDERGCGLSDRDVEDLSLDARVRDLGAVVDAAGLERVALLGMSQGGPVAVAYAARHPERVSRLILFGTYARGRLRRDRSALAGEQAQLMVSLIRMGWGQGESTFRRLFTTLFIPDASVEQMRWFDDLQRVTADPEMAVRIREARNHDDVTEEAGRVVSPTLVLHARGDALVPFAEGRLLATLIPGARFVPLDSRNHILLADEPAWEEFRAELGAFLGGVSRLPWDELGRLSNRELDVLALVAEGLDNDDVAARLYVSVRTVERHLSNIYAKLGVTGKAARAAAAVRFSRAHGQQPPVER